VIRGSWGIWLGDSKDEVMLRFAPDARRLVAETRWHESATIKELPDGATEVRMQVASEVEMRPWVLRWGPLVEVLSPASMRSFVADSMRRAAALYAGREAGRGVKPKRTG
jgi:predicted DNA-binding transcriptional regulator YafY